MYRDSKFRLRYRAQKEWGFPRDISAQEFLSASKDLLGIITRHYEALENRDENKGKIIFGDKIHKAKVLENEAAIVSIYDFSGSIPFHTHSIRGEIRTYYEEPDTKRYALLSSVGLGLSLVPSAYVYFAEENPLYSLLGLLPGLGVVAPALFELSREEAKKQVKCIELELHIRERRNGHNGRVENLLGHLQAYTIASQKP